MLALQRAGLTHLLTALGTEFISTEDVAEELRLGTAQGLMDVPMDGVRIIPLKTSFHPSLAIELDAGEASVIQAAMENGVEWVCIDELAGRFKAEALELQVVGTLGLLAKAKRMGLIPAARPAIQKMAEMGTWFGKELVARYLKSLGE
jgi:predicted nucleic acid-binding protein